ncbi:MAG: glycoside hydrolase family 28 protein [Lachnospira sp.]|nr:glycoside hydrolase family 28 protein [Lachnospira sp.]
MKAKDFDIKLPAFVDRTVHINDYGAKPYAYSYEDSNNNAAAINRAITYVSEKGGGVVVIPEGIWYTAPIEIKSDVCLKLMKNAVLKFSKDYRQYPLIKTSYEGQDCIRTISPITADHAINIGITGEGTIDGSGDMWRPVKQFKLTEKQWNNLLSKSQYVIQTKEGGIWFPTETSFKGNEANIQFDADKCIMTDDTLSEATVSPDEEKALKEAAPYYDFYRPVMVSLRYCKRVLLDGVTFMNSPAWNIHPYFCKNLTVRNVKINNPYYAQNGDGIDIESCNKVHIHDCIFETGDDAICVKSGKNAVARQIEGPCENVYIHDCIVNEGHGGFVIGSEMSRGVKDVLVEKCTFIGTDVGVRMKSAVGRGGTVENIEIRDINMTNIKGEAIILSMSYVLNSLNRNEEINSIDESDIPHFTDITMDNINCMGAKIPVKVDPVSTRNDTIKNIKISNSNFAASGDCVINGDKDSVEFINTEFVKF